MLRRPDTCLLICLLAVVALASCSGRGGMGRAEVDEHGVIVTVYDDSDMVGEVDPFSMQEGTVYGLGQGEETYLLSGARFVGRTPDGSIFVADSRERTVHCFSEDGAHQFSFGQRGEGPGDFQTLGYSVLGPESLTVWDSRLRRLSIFGHDGTLEQVLRLSVGFQGPAPEQVIPFDMSGTLNYLSIGRIQRTEGVGPPPSEARTIGTFHVSVLNGSLELVATLIDSSVTLRSIRLGNESRMYAPVAMRFARVLPIFEAAPDLPVAWSWSTEYRIDFLDLSDESRWAVRIEKPPIPVPEALKDQEYERWDSWGLGEQARRHLLISDQLPHIEGLLWGSDGNLWVHEHAGFRTEAELYQFTVFDTGGLPLFKQILPFLPSAIIDDVCYVGSEDQEGNPVIRSYHLSTRQ